VTVNIAKLASIGTAALRAERPDLVRLERTFGRSASRAIAAVLGTKNGFYAFEGALHVLPDIADPPERGLYDWNEATLWRADYEGMAQAAVFFAEDAFGTQFCVQDGVIATFNPETGAFERMAQDADEWAAKILGDYAFWSGHPVARAWQAQHGSLPIGSRLVPTTPFVLGGNYDVANLHAIDSVEGMRYRASIAVQIRDLPDGATIALKVVE
jgi:hypothetical protein